jgi:deazaflavin-dependent oxidoreductase (nitroreductase family)
MANKMDLLARVTNKVHQLIFHASNGRIGDRLMRVEIVMLTTTGRRSGEPRRSMVGAPIVEGDKIVVCASYGGAPNHPQWLLNLRAEPIVELTRLGTTRQMRAREAEGDERNVLWTRVVSFYKNYERYQAKTDRQIPVVVLEPVH